MHISQNLILGPDLENICLPRAISSMRQSLVFLFIYDFEVIFSTSLYHFGCLVLYSWGEPNILHGILNLFSFLKLLYVPRYLLYRLDGFLCRHE